MKQVRSMIGLAAGLVAAQLGSAAAATSAMTDAFVAATRPAYGALRDADDLARTGHGSRHFIAFARRDTAEQDEAADALEAWAAGEQRAAKAASQTRSIDGLGPLFYPYDAEVLPLPLHGRVTTEAYRAGVARLTVLQGREFDETYADTQAAILRRLVSVYTDYIKNGDDPGLRLLSVRNLPRVEHLLAELHRS